MGRMVMVFGDDLDPRSIEAVEWALWCTGMCRCDKCDRWDDALPDPSDPPWNGDIQSWAKEMAPKVQANGWSMSVDAFNLRCCNC